MKPEPRKRHDMPTDISDALETAGLKDQYNFRPPYQRNDYIGWITRAKRDKTRLKRIAQMLEELKGGTTYMKMKWRAK
jgi:uncharacterized protein YdeI (YjbR/CyaY-like superfamily)